ncbi:hypothetical protein [Streptomyces sp. NRRL F-5135]|uniref:hypothetical protein n=1 Tax=Streptomyces sp. NRRL F-5135 TaxID=1463858 RepID=UPI000A473C0A|nr:hypothetical protein [Streptomyces sp. NRRL F-5135]
MKIGPRTGEMENRVRHAWNREIDGIPFSFMHVKVSNLGRPYLLVSRMDTHELVRCSCPRPDCPFAN